MTEQEHFDAVVAQQWPWMNAAQKKCLRLIADAFGGLHHLPSDKPKPQSDTGIKVTCVEDLATFDYDRLTRLVVFAHDRAIRVCIISTGRPRLGIVAHYRGRREGDSYYRHPTLEDAAARIRERYPQPEVL